MIDSFIAISARPQLLVLVLTANHRVSQSFCGFSVTSPHIHTTLQKHIMSSRVTTETLSPSKPHLLVLSAAVT